jgi:hypothetical protein
MLFPFLVCVCACMHVRIFLTVRVIYQIGKISVSYGDCVKHLIVMLDGKLYFHQNANFMYA